MRYVCLCTATYKLLCMLLLQEVVEGLEIIFISSDKSPEEMESYIKESHGDWLAVPHNSSLADDLKQKYGKMSCYFS